MKQQRVESRERNLPGYLKEVFERKHYIKGITKTLVFALVIYILKLKMNNAKCSLINENCKTAITT